MRAYNALHESAISRRRCRDPSVEGLIREGAILPANKRYDALMMVIVKSAHADSAEAARRAYYRALEASNDAIVNVCMAVYSDSPQRRERAVSALAGRRDELLAVSVDSRYPETREMAIDMLRRAPAGGQ